MGGKVLLEAMRLEEPGVIPLSKGSVGDSWGSET